MKNKPQIYLKYPDDIPESIVTEITDELRAEKLDLIIERKPMVPYACLEWAIPGVIIVFIAQSYFGAFLKEAGKDHYNILKKWLKKTTTQSRLIDVSTITSDLSPKKISNNNTQSETISIYFETIDKKQIKLLFDTRLNNTVWESRIDEILELVLDNNLNYPNDYLTKTLNKFETEEKDFYGIIDYETSRWVFLDQKKLIELSRIKNGS